LICFFRVSEFVVRSLDESTGSHSVYREWRNFQVMFHVSTLMPFSHSTEDRQQIQRKRHIGNDIVTLVFIDGYGQYDPRTIKSQFLHVFIAIQRIKSTTPGVARYRVAVGSNEDVPEFGPWVPKPAEFDETDEFRHFLFAKSKTSFTEIKNNPPPKKKKKRKRKTQ